MSPEDVTDEMLDAAQAVADQASLFDDPWRTKRAVLAAAINAMLQQNNTVADAAIKSAFVGCHGTDAKWLGVEGSYFVSGWSARTKLNSCPPDTQIQIDAELAALRAERDDLRKILADAIESHGIILLSDPPQEAWKYNRIEARARAALKENEK